MPEKTRPSFWLPESHKGQDTPKSHRKYSRCYVLGEGVPGDHQKKPQDHSGTTRGPPEDHQKTMRGPSGDHQKTIRDHQADHQMTTAWPRSLTRKSCSRWVRSISRRWRTGERVWCPKKRGLPFGFLSPTKGKTHQRATGNIAVVMFWGKGFQGTTKKNHRTIRGTPTDHQKTMRGGPSGDHQKTTRTTRGPPQGPPITRPNWGMGGRMR